MAEPQDADDADDDAAALRWAGDEERGRPAPRLGSGETVLDAQLGSADVVAPIPGRRARTATTVAFALPYLVWAVAWILAVQTRTSGSTALSTEILWQFGEFLTILACPLWFAATVHLSRTARALVRVGWLALGLGVLLPWPFLLDLLAALDFAGSLT